MKNKILLLLIFSFLVLSDNAFSDVQDAIIAVVNDEIITYKELGDYLHTSYMQLKSEGKNDAQIEKMWGDLQSDGLSRLIEDRLILHSANKLGVIVRDRLINERIEDIKKRYKSEADFINSLTQNGLTITDLKNKITDQLKVKFMVDQEVKNKIFINPQEVTDYYTQNSDRFNRPERIVLDSIFVSKKNNAESARAKIEQALQKVREGSDFGEIAKDFSEAGSIGYIEKGQMIPSLEQAIFKLKEKDISDIIEVDNGFYIFKIKEKLQGYQAPLSDVKDKIYDILFNQNFRLHYEEWIAKLKKDAYIEIKQ